MTLYVDGHPASWRAYWWVALEDTVFSAFRQLVGR